MRVSEQPQSNLITVGKGYGFFVAGNSTKYIVTASDLLPWHEEVEIPKLRGLKGLANRASRAAFNFSDIFKIPMPPDVHALPPFIWRSFQGSIYNLIGPKGQKPTIAASCVFVDPISGLAVLSSPDGNDYDYAENFERYAELANSVQPLRISDVSTISQNIEDEDRYEARVWMLSMAGDLVPYIASYASHLIGDRAIVDTLTLWDEEELRSGEFDPSHSSGLTPLLDIGAPILAADGSAVGIWGGYGNPRLTSHLPGWLLHEMGCNGPPSST